MHKKSATKKREKEASVVLGTMTFGGQTDEETSLQMVQEFLARGHRELDTAFLYQKGHTEEILGRILAKERQERGDSGIAPYVATKVNPWGYSGRSLKPADVKKQASPPLTPRLFACPFLTRCLLQFTTSLQRLQVDSVDLLYLHGPDFKNPIGMNTNP
ncbi:aldoketo reductase family 7, member A3 isoform 2, putative [Acanthamoeba castellanii str. Neff]|uniref:Aldoketo reductase family 7, member A3 isoform 2, putative n=1 Tax=Acanthamoeba castellanii (strain ATCC 30010 / Neff) TaxID=1257118 RepID=L8GU01_ACACF|nr:aldoketo reductase family 7, member A3 isoform 2, putative [Acanthamoeba castellanii str. Neff]ELR16500.1 aldoketo reductase family 7, member A3 isoform 2, putative [Acanthamoeba castellanii str. Neff]